MTLVCEELQLFLVNSVDGGNLDESLKSPDPWSRYSIDNYCWVSHFWTQVSNYGTAHLIHHSNYFQEFVDLTPETFVC